jgi:hypothetical protein
MMAQRARTTFTVRVFPNGQPWIHLESKVVRGGFLAFDLRRGATRDEAEQVADYLNTKITQVSYVPLLQGRPRKVRR